MRKLILVKHAQPVVRPEVPAAQWGLSDEGRRKCEALAQRLATHEPAMIVTSEEPKAIETGQIVGRGLGLPVESAAGLHEHDRSNVPHMPSREFLSFMALFFQRPDELVLGTESAADAKSRFSAAVDRVMERHAQQNVAIVTHGTVLSLYIAEMTREPSFALWRKMQLPSYAVIEWPECTVRDVCARVE
jgi:broad specificity phosphatase PhoE